jgi:hypothetical protein
MKHLEWGPFRCLYHWPSNIPPKNSCRNNRLVVFGGFTVQVHAHGLTQAIDEFHRSVASVAKHAHQSVATK